MSDLTTGKNLEYTLWKRLFIVFALLIVIIMPYLSKDYGMSGDEWLQIQYGEHIWNYFAKGDKQALDYSHMSLQYQNMEFYGGMFDFAMDAMHRVLPSVPLLTFRHFFNALLGALMMIFTGLITFRISKKWSVALLALLFIVLSPRLFGESMNNPKDPPFACGFVIALYGIIALLQDFPRRSWINAIAIALGFGLAFGVRPAGGLLLLAYILMFTGFNYLINKDFRILLQQDGHKLLKKLILLLFLALAFGYTMGLLTWPWGLQAPLSNPIESLRQMTNIEIHLRVLFEGVYRMNNEMPWYYEFKWLFISNPLIILAGTVLFLFFIPKAIKKYGLLNVFIIVFCAFFPLLYMIYKHSSVHDTWRHVIFVYTSWVVISALAFDILGDFIKNEKLKTLPMVVAILGLVPVMIWMVRSHPNQYVYFNELIGGPEAAYGYYDLDYYQNSGKQAADWIKKHGKRVPGKKILVRSNMSAIGLYYEKDTSWIVGDYGRYTDRSHLDWDYYIAYPRYMPATVMQNNKWILSNTVHKVEIDGVPLCVVIERKSLAGIDAYNAFEKKDYATAVQKYAEYLKTDTTDEYVYADYAISLASIGQIDAGLAALQKAFELDPEQPQYLELQAEFYKAKGDIQGYQTMMQKAQALAAEQQEEQE